MNNWRKDRREIARWIIRKVASHYFFDGEGQNPVPIEEIIEGAEKYVKEHNLMDVPIAMLIEAARKEKVPLE